jgi:hypothetical protein
VNPCPLEPFQHKRKELKKGGEMVILVLKVMEKKGDYHP